MKFTHESIYALLVPYCTPAANFIVGYSGGVDSHVLLHLLAKIPQFKQKITAVYVHHGLLQCADEWAEHCHEIAKDLQVNFRVIKVDAQAQQGQSPEEAARNARYQAFKEILLDGDVLLFAQHRNDQLETVLLQLFRGAGLKGLSGMPVEIAFSKGTLLRPLLEVTQQEIIQYAKQHKLKWIEDPSNQDMRFERNYLRQNIIPLLEPRWPGIDKTVTRAAKHCAQAHSFISNDIQDKMQAIYHADNKSLSISGLLRHDDITQQWLIREWMHHLDARMPSQKVLMAILHDVLPAHQEANPVVRHGEYSVQRYRDSLYLVIAQKEPDLSQIINWDDKNVSLSLPDNGELLFMDAKQGIARQAWQQGKIQVKYRKGGEKIALTNRIGRHSLKKLYQEAGIAPWQRDVIPLLYINGELAAIAGYWVAADFFVQSEPCFSLFWEKSRENNVKINS